jgi:hypothetical protein
MSAVVMLHPPNPQDVAAQKFCRAVGGLCRAYRRLLALDDPELTEMISSELLAALRDPTIDNPPVSDLVRAVASAVAAEAVEMRLDQPPAAPPNDDDGEAVPVAA